MYFSHLCSLPAVLLISWTMDVDHHNYLVGEIPSWWVACGFIIGFKVIRVSSII